MKIKPLSDRVIVKAKEAEERTASGIILPDTAKEKPQIGEVVSVGPGKANDAGNLVKMSVKKGDKVFMIYNEFKSVMAQEVIVEQLLPIVPENLEDKKDSFAVDYVYEPDEGAILEDLMNR